MPLINERLLDVPVVYTKKITEGIKDDPDVVNLARGESEFTVPEPVIEYLNNILSSKDPKWMGYSKTKGSKNLRDAISRKYMRESGIDIDPDSILVTHGGTNAIFVSLLSVTNPGDEIIIPDPAYVAYDPIVNFAIPSITGRRVPLYESNGFVPKIEDLDRCKSDRTKAIIITSPLNPTGSVYSREAMKEIMEWGARNDIFVIHDENHEKEVYDSHIHYPVSLFDQEFDNSILLNSFSRLGMGGWRLGWMIANRKVIKAATAAQLYVNMNINSFVQEAGRFVLDNYDSLGFDSYFRLYQEKRDYLVPELNKIDGFSCRVPMGTCYVFVNVKDFYVRNKNRILPMIRERILNSRRIPNSDINSELELLDTSISYAIHKYLLYHAKVGVIPGIAYGPKGDEFVRLSFSVKRDTLEEAVRRLNIKM